VGSRDTLCQMGVSNTQEKGRFGVKSAAKTRNYKLQLRLANKNKVIQHTAELVTDYVPYTLSA